MSVSKKVKLTYVANARFPTRRAHGIQIAKMCEAFIDEGVEVELVVPKRGSSNKNDPKEYYGLHNSFSVKILPVITLASSTRFGFRLSAISFAVISFFYLLLKKDIDVIYSIDMDHVSYFGVALALFLSKKPGFVEMHAPKKNTIVHRMLFKNIAGVFAINTIIAEKLVHTFPCLEGKVIVCPNGVDVEKYKTFTRKKSRSALHIPEKTISAIYTGSFQDWKGIGTIIEAAEKISDVTFYFVGGSREDLEKLGIAVPSLTNVQFIGKRPFKEMPLWHKSADILLVTGTNKDRYSSEHTSPMKLFEYMAAEKPIVASRTRAIEQIVSDKEVFFHNPDDVDDLVKTVKTVLQQGNSAKEKAQAAYELAKRCSWQVRVNTIKKYIQARV